MISTDYSKSEEMAKELTDRNCEKCVHHLSGYCDSWDCNMQTVDDVKKEAINKYIKAVVDELEETKETSLELVKLPKFLKKDLQELVNMCFDEAIEIVKQGDVSDDVCEWELKNACYTTSIKHYYSLPTSIVKTFNNCPYCGKKIKIVGD